MKQFKPAEQLKVETEKEFDNQLNACVERISSQIESAKRELSYGVNVDIPFEFEDTLIQMLRDAGYKIRSVAMNEWWVSWE